MRNGLIAVVLAAGLAGCVTHVPRPDQIAPTPQERLHAFQEPIENGGEVVVTRDAGFSGSGCYAAVFVNGKQVAEMNPSERAAFHLPSGESILGVWNTGKALCGYREGKDRREISVVLHPGETKHYRIIVNPNAGISLEPTTL